MKKTKLRLTHKAQIHPRICSFFLCLVLTGMVGCFPGGADSENENQENDPEQSENQNSFSEGNSNSDKTDVGPDENTPPSDDSNSEDDNNSENESDDNESSENRNSESESSEGENGETAANDQEKEEEEDRSSWIQLSFKGAKVDMIVEWLSKETGKSIIKHPRVQCQLTIVSSNKMPKQEALRLVYNALTLEGYTTVENAKSIMIVPSGEVDNIRTEMISKDVDNAQERERVVKVFQLNHIDASDLEDIIEETLSSNANIDADDTVNKLVVSDYAQNIRMLEELVQEIDVPNSTDSIIEIIELKYADAEELAELLESVLSGGGSSSRSRSSYYRSRSSRDRGNNGEIRLWPDQYSNRIIVSAPERKIRDVRKMIETLDAEKPEDLTIRVIPLKHMDAEDLMDEIGPLYDRLSASSLKGMIELAANSRSNSLIVLSNKVNFESIQELVKRLDTEDAQQKVVQVFTLGNAEAADVAQQLQQLFEDSGTSRSRYSYSYYRNRGGNDEVTTTFVADPRRNAVIVQGSPANLQAVEDMIDTLDQPISGESLAPKIFTLRYVSAIEIETVLNELFSEDQGQTRNYWNSYSYNPFGSSSSSSSGAGRMFGKIRITSESYSNSIIVTSNSQENLDAVEAMIKTLDVPSEAGESTLRLTLRYSKAVEIANAMNILFAKAGSPPMRQNQNNQNQGNQNNNNQNNNNNDTDRNFELEQEARGETYFPWLGGPAEDNRGFGGQTTTTRPVSDLVGKVRIVPEPRTNSLLVTSSVHFLPQILKLLNEMDRPTAQVLINTKVVEVSTDFRKKIGTRFSPDGDATFDADDKDQSVMIGSEAVFRRVFTGTEVGNSNKSGIVSTSMNLDVLLQFMRKNSDAKTMAEPQLNIADNEIGKLFVGSEVPYVSGSNTTPQGGLSSQIEYKNVGIILEVTPKINSSEEVSLSIRLEASSIRAGETIQGSPIFDTREFRTDLVVDNGQTLILGGIIQNEETEVIRKVPILGDIPGLGYLFKKKDDVKRDVELMVFLQPTITRSPEEVQKLMESIDSKTPKIRQYNEELNAESAKIEEEAE